MSSLPSRQPMSFGGGLRAFLGGVGFIIGTPGVWGWALVPAFLALVMLIVSCSLGLWAGSHLADWLMGEVTGFWATTGSWLLKTGLWLLAIILSLLLALFLTQPLSGFALEAIVRAQERDLGHPHGEPPGRVSALLLTVQATGLSLGFGIPAIVGLTVVGLLFPPAIIVTLPLKFLICAWMLAWDFLDYPLGLRGMPVSARLSWISRRMGAFTAFGLAWTSLLIVPGMVLLILPMGVAGATRMVVQEEA